MDHSSLMRELNGPGHLFDQGGGLSRIPGRSVKSLGKRATFDQLQGQVRRSIMLAIVINLDDLRMVQRGNDFGLGAKTGQQLIVVQIGPSHHFERDESVQCLLSGLVDHAHPAASKHFEYFIIGFQLGRHWPRFGGRLAVGARRQRAGYRTAEFAKASCRPS